MEPTREQVKNVPNPTGKGGFQERPQDRSRGTWSSENTISFQYRRFMSMTPAQINAWVKEPDDNKTMAMILAYNRVKEANKSLPDMKEITDRTEGKAAQSVDLTTNGKELPTPIIDLTALRNIVKPE